MKCKGCEPQNNHVSQDCPVHGEDKSQFAGQWPAGVSVDRPGAGLYNDRRGEKR